MTEMPYEEQKSHVTLLIYGSIVAVSLLLSLASSFCYYLTALRASEKLHSAMTEAVLKAPALFFDRNPAGRILNRFSKDLGCMDDLLPGQSLFTIQLLLFLVNGNVLSAVSNVWLFLICVPLMLLFIFLANFYLRSSREFRRIEAMTCSPLYSCVADTVTGLEIIRSSAMEKEFIQRLYRLVFRGRVCVVVVAFAFLQLMWPEFDPGLDIMRGLNCWFFSLRDLSTVSLDFPYHRKPKIK